MTREKLSKHQDTHKNTKQFCCPHKNCNRVFLRQSHLKNHLKIHTQDHQFVCPVLGKPKLFVDLIVAYLGVLPRDQLSWNQLLIDQLPIDQLPLNQLPIDQLEQSNLRGVDPVESWSIGSWSDFVRVDLVGLTRYLVVCCFLLTCLFTCLLLLFTCLVSYCNKNPRTNVYFALCTLHSIDCSQKFSSEADYNEHLNTHINYGHRCPHADCKLSFPTPSRLELHCRAVHSNSGNHSLVTRTISNNYRVSPM